MKRLLWRPTSQESHRVRVSASHGAAHTMGPARHRPHASGSIRYAFAGSGRNEDRSTLVFNRHITLRGIPQGPTAAKSTGSPPMAPVHDKGAPLLPAPAFISPTRAPGRPCRRGSKCRVYPFWCCPSTPSSSTPANCWPTARVASATSEGSGIGRDQFVEAILQSPLVERNPGPRAIGRSEAAVSWSERLPVHYPFARCFVRRIQRRAADRCGIARRQCYCRSPHDESFCRPYRSCRRTTSSSSVVLASSTTVSMIAIIRCRTPGRMCTDSSGSSSNESRSPLPVPTSNNRRPACTQIVSSLRS